MKPTSSMIASTDPDDVTCEATFEVEGRLPYTTRLTNKQYFKIAAAIEQAYYSGRDDGSRLVAVEVKRRISEYL